MKKLWDSVFEEMFDNLNKRMEVKTEGKIIRGYLGNTYKLPPDVYVVLIDCEVEENGEITKEERRRIAILKELRLAEYKFL